MRSTIFLFRVKRKCDEDWSDVVMMEALSCTYVLANVFEIIKGFKRFKRLVFYLFCHIIQTFLYFRETILLGVKRLLLLAYYYITTVEVWKFPP